MKPEAFAHASCMCCVQEKERFSLSFQNLNVRGGVKGRTLGTRLKYPKSANDRASLTARIYPQLPRLTPIKLSVWLQTSSCGIYRFRCVTMAIVVSV